MQKIGKEIKIGLAVIGVLVAAFGYILFRRLTKPDDLAAAPPAATVPGATTAAAGASDKPTVVSATDTGRPLDPAAAGGASSRSLFGSSRRPASDSADAAADPRSSFMPPASSDASAANGVAATPESRFSQFGHHADSPSNDGTAKPHDPLASDGSHSLFTAGSVAPAADAPAAPADPFQQRNPAPPTDPVASSSRHRHSASPDAPASPADLSSNNPLQNNLSQGAPSADPFARNSATIDAPPLRAPVTPTAAVTQAAGQMPADPVPPRQAPIDPNEANPLRQAAAPEPPHNMFGNAAPPAATAPPATYASAQTVPPPITSNAINIPSAQVAQPDPVSPTPPPMVDASAPKPGQYIVQPNDNYWTVSETVYGTGGYFKAIYEHNRRLHSQSDRLQVGDALDVPEVAVLEQAYPDLCPKQGGGPAATPATAVAASSRPQTPGTRSYSVADGDTLYEIARRELGNASRWGEIYQLNHDQLGNDFGYLRPGSQLLIPSDASAASIAREPTGAFQR